MFKLPYLYYFLAAWLLLVCLSRVRAKQHKMNGVYPTIVFALCTVSMIVLLILGFWFMPHWWYPLVFFGISLVASMIPIPDMFGAKLSLVAAPILCVLAYLSLFGVI